MFVINKKLLLGFTVPSLLSLSLFVNWNNLSEYKIMVNYNGQADLLLSLQIPSDYYPYQFKRAHLYDHLTHIDRYLVSNNKVSKEKRVLKDKLQGKIDSLLSRVKEFGPSLWNDELYETGLVYRNNQFWSSKKTNLFFLEQFVSDDYQSLQDSYDVFPIHKNLIITNYRAARDPYTIFPKKVFDCFKDEGCEKTDNALAIKFKEYMRNYEQEESTSLYRFGKFIDFWNNLTEKHQNLLNTLKFNELVKENNRNLFSLDDTQDENISKKYLNAVFSKEEICLLHKWSGGDCDTSDEKWTMNYKSKSVLTHHPALEQQTIPGTAPLSEGSQKDMIVYLYQFAALIKTYTESKDFIKDFKDDYRKEALLSALNNAYQISQDLNTRINNIRDYFKEIKVVDQNFNPSSNNYSNKNSKTFTIVTYPPSAYGAGDATIQSMSKFPWLYKDIGLKQPIPHDWEGETFSVDDNGWWWNIGSANLDPTNLLKFQTTTDTLLVLANEDDWNLLQDTKSGTLNAITSLLKNKQELDIEKIRNKEQYPISYTKYHLWNEGLRSPIALNLLLDNLVDIFQKQYDDDWSIDKGNKYSEAMNWGTYWNHYFLNGTHSPLPS